MDAHPLYPCFAEALAPSSEAIAAAFTTTTTTSTVLHALPFAVYLDLLLAKEFADAQPIHVPRISRIVLLVWRDRGGEEEIVVPMTKQESWSVKSLGSTFAALHDIRPELESLVLAIVASDSTVVYYRIHKGLVPPVEEKDD
ncbi:Sen15 protein-domain-containing protein [Geranomyces variabilis]|nr:Sen15 protein-domain-containing protein [Geranomyces variabilis]KAJ3136898.1 hypothetical protein HDU90_002464 [Geranomyces variabilis]